MVIYCKVDAGIQVRNEYDEAGKSEKAIQALRNGMCKEVDLDLSVYFLQGDDFNQKE